MWQALAVAAAQSTLDINEVATAVNRQFRSELIMSEKAGVAGAGGEAGSKALPEAVQARTQVVDDLGGQPHRAGLWRLDVCTSEGLHDPG